MDRGHNFCLEVTVVLKAQEGTSLVPSDDGRINESRVTDRERKGKVNRDEGDSRNSGDSKRLAF